MTRKAIRRLTTQAAPIQNYLGDFLSIARTSKVRRGTATRIVPLVALRAAAHAAHAVVKGLPRLELVGVQGGLDRGDSCHAAPQEQAPPYNEAWYRWSCLLLIPLRPFHACLHV